MSEFFRWEGNALVLNLYVQPNAKKDAFAGEYGDNLKVRITAQPIDNKANKHLLKFLAKSFSVPQSQITLLSGLTQRSKRVQILNPCQIPASISQIKLEN
ncbi:MAG: DUF167 family protein [Gammaproteobacteria bacterium]|nr:DUF167 family protein [Gammaproteobacteria bacterium]